MIRSLFALLAAGVWSCSSLLLFDKLGLTKQFCGMEIIQDERKFYLLAMAAGINSDMAFLMQMDAPESLDSFATWMKAHFTQHPIY